MTCKECGFQSFDTELYRNHVAAHIADIIEKHLLTLPPKERVERQKIAHRNFRRRQKRK